MSIELAQALYDHIGKITHLRTFEFLKVIAENQDEDGFSRITYASWRDKHHLHAFILNACTDECERLHFIEVFRENKEGVAKNGGKGTKRIYRLTLDKLGSTTESKSQKGDESTKETEKQEKRPVTSPKAVSPKNRKNKVVKKSKTKTAAKKPSPKKSAKKPSTKSNVTVIKKTAEKKAIRKK